MLKYFKTAAFFGGGEKRIKKDISTRSIQKDGRENNMRKRIITGLLAAVLALAALTGCGSTKVKEEENITISVWTYYNGAQLKAFNELIEQFNKTVGAEKGIYVQGSSFGSVGDLETNVMDAAKGKVGAEEIPDIYGAYADTAYAMDQMGLVADLRPYFTDEELERYIPSYIEEGGFSESGSIKIFPVAKSTELFLLNKTDWDVFAEATGARLEDLRTIESLTRTAQKYYEWTDSLTPEANDGRAFFGRDAMANYLIIGSMQLGDEIFHVEDGVMTLRFEESAARRLWDNYYVPFIKGYFAASGRFRSDDAKTGNILCFVGSSSGATFFPKSISVSDTESYEIEMKVLPCPEFEGSEGYAVQQGAGLVVTEKDDKRVAAAVEFLKWFTQDEQNVSFSTNSGYMPVTKAGNTLDAVLKNFPEGSDDVMREILTVGIETVNSDTLYTPKAFRGGSDARKVLEYSMSDLAAQDRATVVERLAEGQSLEQATADFTSDEYFKAWYEKTLKALKAFEG